MGEPQKADKAASKPKAVKYDYPAKLARNPGSRKFAIWAKCFDCVGGDQDLGWTDSIRHCPVVACALHDFRPMKPRC